MAEPRVEGSLADLVFRRPGAARRSEANALDRFWLGVGIFLLVAAVYPFYSYHVQAWLLARDLTTAANEATAQIEQMTLEANREIRASQQRRAEQSLTERRRTVSLAGTTIIGGKRIVIVDLGQSNLAEARDVICLQAARQFRESLAGEQLRVQRHRGRQPAVDVGNITC